MSVSKATKGGGEGKFGSSVFPARYELGELLGRGGGGEVWAARDRATGQAVAIKALHQGYHPSEAEALVRETTTLSGLEGLGFPRVLHLGRSVDGRLFLVRELIDGRSFAEVEEEEPRRALSLLYSVASVLVVVHRAGLLHGDIKPQNVIVRADDTVALVDLGLATALREGGQSTVGLTPHYAAPEVRASGPLTVQAEVYSLGVMLRDLLGAGAEGGMAYGSVRSLAALASRATADDPAQRFPSVDEFAEALRGALSGDVPALKSAGSPWPVKGIEAVSYQLGKGIGGLSSGATWRLFGAAGSGRSTLLRRAAWGAALRGDRVVYLDDVVIVGRFACEELELTNYENVLVVVDSESSALDAALDAAARAGARVVRLAASEAEADLVIPPLARSVICELFRGALPGMPKELVDLVVARLGGYPGPLRQFAQLAEGLSVSTEPDIVRILSGSTQVEGPALEVIETYLDRGNYSAAALRLSELDRGSAHADWLKARYELAAGSPRSALEYAESALLKHPERALGERARATLSRAKLGMGDYAGVLLELESVEDWHLAARAEGLAYRGLAESFLGQKEAAEETLKRALVLAQEAKSLRLGALIGASLATARWRAGDHLGAEQSYRQALDAAREVGDAGMLASTCINFAGLMKERGDLAASIELLETAVDAARRAGRTTSLQQALLNLTNADLYLGRLERARAQIARVGDVAHLSAALLAQLHGLKAELLARTGDVEAALFEYEACERDWAALGRLVDASEAALEAVLVAAAPTREGPPSGRYVPSLAVLEDLLRRGADLLLGEETPLLLLAQARVAYFSGDDKRAEERAEKARLLAEQRSNREWAWRSASLLSDLLEAAGKRTRAQRAREAAVEILEEIGARLPQDLREVYWSDVRRRQLREEVVQERPSAPPSAGSGAYRESSAGLGTDAISRLTMTPLERRLARVLAINSDLAGEVDIGRLSTKIVAHACELLSAERGYLLLGKSAAELTVCAARGGQGEGHQEFSRSIAAEVLAQGRPIVSVDAGHDPRLQAFESVHLSHVSAVACVPILSPQGACIGALYVETRTGVRAGFGDEVPMLQAFADQAAIALENARLLSELRLKSADLEERNQHLLEARAGLKELLGKRTARLREVKRELTTTLSLISTHTAYGGMVGASASMRRIYSLIDRVKDTDVPVLITGESGTGKEVAVRAIHEGSSRGKGKLLAVNCGAIPESILESELFGHVRGAFTGADRDRKGLFREADGGVLFLDEIGETPLRMQTSLLRTLQDGVVRPVGAAEQFSVNVRVVFATNRDLTQAVKDGTFREDLLYRIRVVEIALPPLRERREDIPLLCDHFLQRFAVRFGAEKKSLSREGLTKLLEHPMPGNIRQLENALLSAWVLSDGPVIEAEDLDLPPVLSGAASTASVSTEPEKQGREGPPAASGPASRARSSHHKPVKRGSLSEHQRAERTKMVEALEATGWNRLKAAEFLDMPRRTFYRRLRDYDIQ